jgi:hypothetical protein
VKGGGPRAAHFRGEPVLSAGRYEIAGSQAEPQCEEEEADDGVRRKVESENVSTRLTGSARNGAKWADANKGLDRNRRDEP